MAVVRQRDEDQLFSNALDRGQGGLAGADANTSGQMAMPQQPTQSGSGFVNLQRYLEQNPTNDITNSIKNFANSANDKENQSFNQIVSPAQQFIKTQGPLSQNKVDEASIYNSFNALGAPKASYVPEYNKLGDIIQGKQVDASSPGYNSPLSYSPSLEFKQSQQAVQNPFLPRVPGSNDTSLASFLASNKSTYTPGMESLDTALFRSNPNTPNVLKESQDMFNKTLANQDSQLSSVNNQVAGIKNAFENQTKGAQQAAKNVIGSQSGAITSDEDLKKYQQLATWLGQDPSLVHKAGPPGSLDTGPVNNPSYAKNLDMANWHRRWF